MDELHNQKFDVQGASKMKKKNNFLSKIFDRIKTFPKPALIIISAASISIIVLIILWLSGVICSHNNCFEYVHSDATCTTPGNIGYECMRCKKSIIEWGAIPVKEHDWQEATCTSAKKCANCNATQGEALEHNWQEATCTSAKKCANCNATQGKALEHNWQEATCTSAKKCSVCGRTEGYALGHDYTNTTNGTCTRCGFGVIFILPNTPITIRYNGGWDKECKIESIKIERIQESSYSTPYYRLTFIVESTYHEKGNNYSDLACFGWKLYDEDGLVVTSGTGYTDGDIKVGEKSKKTITFYIGEDKYVQYGKTYRFELLNIS